MVVAIMGADDDYTGEPISASLRDGPHFPAHNLDDDHHDYRHGHDEAYALDVLRCDRDPFILIFVCFISRIK